MRLSFLLVLCLCCLALAKAQRKSSPSLGSRTPPTGGSPSEIVRFLEQLGDFPQCAGPCDSPACDPHTCDCQVFGPSSRCVPRDSKVSPKGRVLIATITNNLKFAARGAVTIANNQQIRYNVAAGATMQVTQTKPFLVYNITASYTANNVGYSCKSKGINGNNRPKVVISLIGEGPRCQIKQTIGTGK